MTFPLNQWWQGTWLDGSWDVFYIDGLPLPGRVKKCDVAPARDIEKVKPDGVDTPHTKDNGYTGATIDLEIELWRAEQALELEETIARISPRQPGALSKPHTISHPITNLANVTEVYIVDYGLSMPSGGRMPFRMTLEEWFSPQTIKKTKQGQSIKNGGVAAGDEPQFGQIPLDDDGGGLFGDGYVPTPNPQDVGPNYP